MRLGFTLVASAIVVGACAGGDRASTGDTGAAATTTTPATPTTQTPAPSGAQPAPATGTVHDVRMTLDGQTYKFEPANLTVKAGDAIKFINVSGGPHNIAFDPAKIPDDVESALSAGMPNQQGPLSSPYLTQPNESYTINFANVKAGTYDFTCTPHSMMGMNGRVTVR